MASPGSHAATAGRHEVWARVAWAAVDLSRELGVSPDSLLVDLPFDAAELRRRKRVAWADYCAIVERVGEAAGGMAELEDLRGARPCEVFFRGSIGALRGVPAHLDLPMAEVTTVEVAPDRAICDVRLPPSPTLSSARCDALRAANARRPPMGGRNIGRVVRATANSAEVVINLVRGNS